MTSAILSTVVIGSIGLLIASGFIGSIAESILNASLTGVSGLIWGLIVGLFGIAIIVVILKEAGIDL
jgi:uncharacterized membrane protein